jgi:hypothetical protein
VVPDAEFVTWRELTKFGFDRDSTTNEDEGSDFGPTAAPSRSESHPVFHRH